MNDPKSALRRYVERLVGADDARQRSRFHARRAFARATGAVVGTGIATTIGLVTGDMHLGFGLLGALAPLGTVAGNLAHSMGWDRRTEDQLSSSDLAARLRLLEDEHEQRQDEINALQVDEDTKKSLRLEVQREYWDERKQLRRSEPTRPAVVRPIRQLEETGVEPKRLGDGRL